MSLVGIANKYGKSKSNVSQIFDTLFHHLRLLFMHDEQFLYTDYARELKYDYLTELKNVFDEMKDEVLGDLFGAVRKQSKILWSFRIYDIRET